MNMEKNQSSRGVIADAGAKIVESQAIQMFKKAVRFKKSEPIYCLLLCRMIGEAYLNKKFFDECNSWPSKTLTLGDLKDKKLGFDGILTREESIGLTHLGKSTNPFLHYKTDDEILSPQSLERVLDFIKQIWGLEQKISGKETQQPELSNVGALYHQLQDTQKVKEKTRLIQHSNINWRQMLGYELERFEWPSIDSTILSNEFLKSQKKHASMTSKKKDLLFNRLIAMSEGEKMNLIISITESILIEYFRIVDSTEGKFLYDDRVIDGNLLSKVMRDILNEALDLQGGNINTLFWDMKLAREKWSFLCEFPIVGRSRKGTIAKRFGVSKKKSGFYVMQFVHDWNFIYFGK